MNTLQQDLLFTDLTLKQAETIAAGVGETSIVGASYGEAQASFGLRSRSGGQAYTVFDGFVKDREPDGRGVYAKFQALTTDGSVLTSSRKRFAEGGFLSSGTPIEAEGGFSKRISKMRVLVYRSDPGRDTVTAGNWVTPRPIA